MNIKLFFLSIVAVAWGMFSFLNGKEGDAQPTAPLLGMVLLKSPTPPDMDAVEDELRNKWGLEVSAIEVENGSAAFQVEGYTIVTAMMDVAIPGNEIQETASFNYLWENGGEEAATHKAHLILSITDAGKDAKQENLIFSKIAAAIMGNSDALGIYMGSRMLLLPMDFYIANVQAANEEDLPLFIWVYFGSHEEHGKQSVYTYGLTDFGKKEMEIVDSRKELRELQELIYDLTHYVIAADMTLKHGETVGHSTDQKLKITESPGKFVDGHTLKISY